MDVEDGHAAAIGWEMDLRPRALGAGHFHVHFLNLTAGEVFFEVEIHTDETEHEGDGLGFRGCGLQREGVRDVLEDKAGTAHRVDVHFVVCRADLIDSNLIHDKRSLEKAGERRKRRGEKRVC